MGGILMDWKEIMKAISSDEAPLSTVEEFFGSIKGTVLMDRRDGRYVEYYVQADKELKDRVMDLIWHVNMMGGPNEKSNYNLVKLIGQVLREDVETKRKDEWDRQH